MEQDAAIDLSFIPAALAGINASLFEAEVAAEMRDTATEHAMLTDASSVALVALEKLYNHPLWDQLHVDQQRRLQQWENFTIPVVDELFVEMGYQPPPPALTLIGLGNKELRQAIGIPEPGAPDPIMAAREAIAKLHQVLHKLLQAMRRSHRFKNALKSAIKVSSKALAQTLGAVILLPAVEAGFRELSPYAVELLHELRDKAPLILPSLSIALMANVRSDIMHWFGGPAAPTIRAAFRPPPARPPSQTSKRISGPTGQMDGPEETTYGPALPGGVLGRPHPVNEPPPRPGEIPSSPPGRHPGGQPGVS